MTRKQLIDYIESFHPSQWPHPEEIADALIEKGFIQVQEPREFWICSKCYCCQPDDGRLHDSFKMASVNGITHKCKGRIIHVREVVK